MHIPPHDNGNRPSSTSMNARVPQNYFNIVKLGTGKNLHLSGAGL